MRYKSKYTVILMVEDKKIREKELEIAEIVTKRNEILRQIKKEEEKNSLFRSYLSSDKPIDAIYLTGTVDLQYEKKLEKELGKLDMELKIKRFEYQTLQEKKKVIKEMDDKEEKQFYSEQRKKEQKKLIGLKAIIKRRENGGD